MFEEGGVTMAKDLELVDGAIVWKGNQIGEYDPREKKVHVLCTIEDCVNNEMSEDETLEIYHMMPQIIVSLIHMGFSIDLQEPRELLAKGLEAPDEEKIREAYHLLWEEVYG